MIYLKKRLYYATMVECEKRQISFYQLITRAVIAYIGYKCQHDFRPTSAKEFLKYRDDGKEYCVLCGMTR
jgi:hypothetical protein